MDTITALLGGIGRGLRWVFDLASMAVGVAPTSVGLTETVASEVAGVAGAGHSGAVRPADPFEDELHSRLFRQELGMNASDL